MQHVTRLALFVPTNSQPATHPSSASSSQTSLYERIRILPTIQPVWFFPKLSMPFSSLETNVRVRARVH